MKMTEKELEAYQKKMERYKAAKTDGLRIKILDAMTNKEMIKFMREDMGKVTYNGTEKYRPGL